MHVRAAFVRRARVMLIREDDARGRRYGSAATPTMSGSRGTCCGSCFGRSQPLTPSADCAEITTECSGVQRSLLRDSQQWHCSRLSVALASLHRRQSITCGRWVQHPSERQTCPERHHVRHSRRAPVSRESTSRTLHCCAVDSLELLDRTRRGRNRRHDIRPSRASWNGVGRGDLPAPL